MGDVGTAKRRVSLGFLAALICLATFAAAGLTFNQRLNGDVENYDLIVTKMPNGFQSRPHSPQAVFALENKKENLLIIAAINRVVSDINPTPELDTEGIAQFYLDRMSENMPEWRSQKLGMVESGGTAFRLIRRERENKAIITAFAVKGNSTMIVSMNANGPAASVVDSHLPRFKDFLASLQTRQRVPKSMN